MKRSLISLTAALLLASGAHAAVKVGVFGGSDGANQQTVANHLAATGQFTSVTGLTGTESAADLASYNVLLVYSNYAQGYSAFGDQLANYVDNGGHLVTATFLAQTLSPGFGQSYGRLQTGGYLPWASYISNYSRSTLGSFAAGTHLLDGVTSLSASYRDIVTVDSSTQVLGSWADGAPLVDKNGKGVVGLFVFPTETYGNVTGDLDQLVANTLTFAANGTTSAVPEPTSLAAMLAGLGVLVAARRRQSRG